MIHIDAVFAGGPKLNVGQVTFGEVKQVLGGEVLTEVVEASFREAPGTALTESGQLTTVPVITLRRVINVLVVAQVGSSHITSRPINHELYGYTTTKPADSSEVNLAIYQDEPSETDYRNAGLARAALFAAKSPDNAKMTLISLWDGTLDTPEELEYFTGLTVHTPGVAIFTNHIPNEDREAHGLDADMPGELIVNEYGGLTPWGIIGAVKQTLRLGGDTDLSEWEETLASIFGLKVDDYRSVERIIRTNDNPLNAAKAILKLAE